MNLCDLEKDLKNKFWKNWRDFETVQTCFENWKRFNYDLKNASNRWNQNGSKILKRFKINLKKVSRDFNGFQRLKRIYIARHEFERFNKTFLNCFECFQIGFSIIFEIKNGLKYQKRCKLNMKKYSTIFKLFWIG